MSTNSEHESMETVGRPDQGRTKKQWTVMIYLSGDNNLSEECVWAIKEMYRVGLKQEIAVVAQYKSIARGMPVTRYDVTAIPAPVTVAPSTAELSTAASST